VLFSQDAVADFINQTFEPAWESVRPVPIVRIDFGNGNVLTRTLHGNILTSVCLPNGLLVDALPGVYTESIYRDRLQNLAQVAQNIQKRSTEMRDAIARVYHRNQVAALKKPAIPVRLADFTKGAVIEAPTLAALRVNNTVVVNQTSAPPVVDRDNPAGWKSLEEDTRLNEQTRRMQIHTLLARTGLVRPDKVTRPVYKDVLHADLDDPYLGLGESLFASYPFAREDAVH
jgi:hypothetical protein